MQNYKDVIRKYILEISPQGNNSNDILENDTNIIEELGIDSINMITLVVKIEEMLGLEIPDEALIMENFSTINKICEQIKIIVNKSEEV